jgi:hypothetical protein
MDAVVTSLITRMLSEDGLQAILKELVLTAEKRLPGASGTEKADWCAQRAVTVLEQFDNSVPVLGAFADLPVIDSLEEAAVKQAVHRAWEMLVSAGVLSA